MLPAMGHEGQTAGLHGTTILAVRRFGRTALAGDGQVTLGSAVLKGGAVKIRRLQDGRVLAGFAGGVADALTLYDRFEAKLREFNSLKRSAVELAKDWRSDRFLRRLEALLLCADAESLLLVSGTGEVIEPDPWPPADDLLRRGGVPPPPLEAVPDASEGGHGSPPLLGGAAGALAIAQPGYDTCLAVGSGSPYATAAARALLQSTGLSAREIALQAMGIAAGLCVYTNSHISVEEIGG